MKSNLKLSKKHFQKDGKWVVRPQRTEIVLCVCGNKYIKTRKNQIMCIWCIARDGEKKKMS